LPDFQLRDIAVTERLRELIARWWRIDILVVADTIGSLGPEHHPNNLNEDNFGMSHLLATLQSVANRWQRGESPGVQRPARAPLAQGLHRFS
jgi:hypothetical protein